MNENLGEANHLPFAVLSVAGVVHLGTIVLSMGAIW